MSNIKDILTINLDEEIQSVIKINSGREKDLLEEIDGFILTESLAKHLHDFCEEYNNGSMKSGVWLSGFYGSGKSYFAKMLGYILKNPVLAGTDVRQRFIPKLTGLTNADLLESNIRGLSRFRTHTVLFDAAKSTATYGLPFMLFANFLRSLGLLDNWIGIIEYNLILNGRHEEFLRTVLANEQLQWKEVYNDLIKSHSVFKRALLSMGMTEDEYATSKKLAEQKRNEFDAIKLQEELQRYLDLHNDTRIVFMIDEVSEAITQEKINLLELEGIAEALADLDRKVWTIAIAQLKLDDVISMKNVSKNLLTKLRDRFMTKIDILAEEVDVIIRKRLLAKAQGARNSLMDYYNHNSGAITDITNLPGLNLEPTKDAATYADYYPFHKYQFRMLQYFLFGSGQMVQTKVGTRGMIISAFDVLRKEVKINYHEHAHVTATQLCRQAELSVDEAQRTRYEQAQNALKDKGLKYVEGAKLLQTIHFLTKTEVTQTTAENICRAYVDTPELYYSVLEEVKQALSLLIDNQIVILSDNQYRITNQTEHRILEDMNNFDVQAYVIRSEITVTMKKLQILNSVKNIHVDGINVNFQIARDDSETIIGNSSESLKILLHDIFVVRESGDRTAYINQVKTATQDQKAVISLIPDVSLANEIAGLVTEIKRIEYIAEKNYTTEEEKRIVTLFKNGLEEKKKQLSDLLTRIA